MLHSEQVKTGWGGVCTVRSKLNKFEHILGARAGVLYEAVRARVEVAGLGPYKVGLGLGLCTGTPPPPVDRMTDGHTRLKTLPLQLR